MRYSKTLVKLLAKEAAAAIESFEIVNLGVDAHARIEIRIEGVLAKYDQEADRIVIAGAVPKFRGARSADLESIALRMKDLDLSRSELARRMGKQPAAVTKAFTKYRWGWKRFRDFGNALGMSFEEMKRGA